MRCPRLTIAIPVFNRKALVLAAIESVLRSSLDSLEVLVVDNCSSDGTWELLLGIGDPRVRVHRNSVNLGMGGNFLKCIELARGEWFRFLMSDDELCSASVDVHELVEQRYTGFEMVLLPGLFGVRERLALDYVFQDSGTLAELDRRSLVAAQGKFGFLPVPAMPNSLLVKTDLARRAISSRQFRGVFPFTATRGHCLDYLLVASCLKEATGVLLFSDPSYRVRDHHDQGSARYARNVAYRAIGDYYVISGLFGRSATNTYAALRNVFRTGLEVLLLDARGVRLRRVSAVIIDMVRSVAVIAGSQLLGRTISASYLEGLCNER